MGNATRIIIADDHPIVRAGVRLLAGSKPELELVGEACTGEEVMTQVAEVHPDVLVLDLWLGEDDGLDILGALCREEFPVQVLIYSMNDEALYGPRAIQAGARGYLMKDRGLDELARAIDVISSGRRYLSESLAEQLIDGSIQVKQPRSDDEAGFLRMLTDRELQVMRLVGRGMGTGEIARNLGVSPKTIGAHRENLKSKLGVASGQELVRLAVTYVEQHAI